MSGDPGEAALPCASRIAGVGSVRYETNELGNDHCFVYDATVSRFWHVSFHIYEGGCVVFEFDDATSLVSVVRDNGDHYKIDSSAVGGMNTAERRHIAGKISAGDTHGMICAMIRWSFLMDIGIERVYVKVTDATGSATAERDLRWLVKMSERPVYGDYIAQLLRGDVALDIKPEVAVAKSCKLPSGKIASVDLAQIHTDIDSTRAQGACLASMVTSGHTVGELVRAKQVYKALPAVDFKDVRAVAAHCDSAVVTKSRELVRAAVVKDVPSVTGLGLHAVCSADASLAPGVVSMPALERQSPVRVVRSKKRVKKTAGRSAFASGFLLGAKKKRVSAPHTGGSASGGPAAVVEAVHEPVVGGGAEDAVEPTHHASLVAPPPGLIKREPILTKAFPGSADTPKREPLGDTAVTPELNAPRTPAEQLVPAAVDRATSPVSEAPPPDVSVVDVELSSEQAAAVRDDERHAKALREKRNSVGDFAAIGEEGLWSPSYVPAVDKFLVGKASESKLQWAVPRGACGDVVTKTRIAKYSAPRQFERNRAVCVGRGRGGCNLHMGADCIPPITKLQLSALIEELGYVRPADVNVVPAYDEMLAEVVALFAGARAGGGALYLCGPSWTWRPGIDPGDDPGLSFLRHVLEIIFHLREWNVRWANLREIYSAIDGDVCSRSASGLYLALCTMSLLGEAKQMAGVHGYRLWFLDAT